MQTAREMSRTRTSQNQRWGELLFLICPTPIPWIGPLQTISYPPRLKGWTCPGVAREMVKGQIEPCIRDGPLEKLWGGEGNFRAAGIFFRYQIPCMNFF